MRSGNRVVLAVLVVVVSVAVLPALALGVHVTGSPEVQILAPLADQTVSSEGIRLDISVSNFTLEPVVPGRLNEANHGHYNVYVNDSWMAENSNNTLDFDDFSDGPGPRKLGVQLVNNDNTSFALQVWHNITINVAAPSIAIVHPASSGEVSTMGARFQVDIQGFELDAENYAGEPIPGHGHYHVFVDGGAPVATPTKPFFDIAAFTPGDHTILVDLRTNNHQLLTPTVEASITVTAVDSIITIVSPANNADVSTEGFQLDVAIAGWELDGENYGGNPIPGHGHYHVFVDGGAPVGTPTTPTFRIDSLTAGSHTITVDLRTNNHQLLSPTVEASITVTAAAPSISILAPADGATVGTTVSLRVDIGGFVIDAEALGQASVPGRGHYHVTVDGTTIDFEVTGPIYAISNLAEGDHTIEASLHNNDHTALSPGVSDQVSITVAAAAPTPPAGVDSLVFIATTVSLLVVLAVVAVVLYLWGRKSQGGT